MKFTSLSDLHIRENGDQASKLFESFIKISTEKNVDRIFLSGDIFDLMAGGHTQYYQQYSIFFDSLKMALSRNIRITYIEGNHDVHLGRLLAKWLKKDNFPLDMVNVISGSVELSDSGKKIYISHGDEWELGNKGYKVYKKILNTRPLSLVANFIFPYSLLEYLGRKASNKSRKKNKYWVDHPEKIQEKTRKGFELLTTLYDYDVVIGGHTHVLDNYSLNGKIYINNGYVPHTKKAILYDGKNLSFVDLSDQ